MSEQQVLSEHDVMPAEGEVTPESPPQQTGWRASLSRLLRREKPALQQLAVEPPVAEIQAGDPINEFRKHFEHARLTPEEREVAVRQLEAAEEVKQIFMEYSAEDLAKIQEAFGTFLGEVVINAELVKAGKLNIADLKRRRNNGARVKDHLTQRNHLKNEPIGYVSAEGVPVIRELAGKLGIPDLEELRGMPAQGGYGQTLMVEVDPLTGERNIDLAAANAHAESAYLAETQHTSTGATDIKGTEEIATNLSSLRATDTYVRLQDRDKAGHRNIDFSLPEDKRDLPHYIIATSTLLVENGLG